MTGLTNKAYANSTLNIDLNNGSTWNLAEKATGTVATSAFDTLAMNGGSTLNGTTQSTSPAKFILKGNVTSTGSTLNLTDGKVGDVLTIQGSYVGNNGNLFLDTVLGDDPHQLISWSSAAVPPARPMSKSPTKAEQGPGR